MSGSVILGLPPALVLYAAALFLALFDRRYRATRGMFTLLGTALALAASAYSLLLGASAMEVTAVLLAFSLLELEGTP